MPYEVSAQLRKCLRGQAKQKIFYSSSTFQIEHRGDEEHFFDLCLHRCRKCNKLTRSFVSLKCKRVSQKLFPSGGKTITKTTNKQKPGKAT